MKSRPDFPLTVGTSVPGTDWLESPIAKSWAAQYLQKQPLAFGSTERHRALQQLTLNQATRFNNGKLAKGPEIQAADELQIAQQLAILSPIRCLPLELLSHIFQLVGRGTSFPDTASCVFTLTLVSHNWGKVAFSTASLWTKVKLYEDYANASPQLAATPAALVRWLAHTKTAPLEIMLFRKWGTQLMWDAISPHLNHVASLDISLRSFSPARRAEILMSLEAEDAPLLRTLKIEAFDEGQFKPGVILEVPCLSHILDLTLKNVVVPLKLLFGCQNLKSLTINHCIDSDASQDPSEVSEQQLPRLETLEISRGRTTHMKAPVSLYHIFAQSPLLRTVTCGWFCQFISHVFGAADITRLIIEYKAGAERPAVVREKIVRLFEELSSLEELSISGSEFPYQGPDTIKDTSIGFGVLATSPWLCPRLREVKLECLKLDKEVILTMSEKRSAETLPVQCRVTTVDCKGVLDVTGALHAELQEAIRQLETGASISD